MEVVRAGANVRIASLACPLKLRSLILSGNIVDTLQQLKVVARGKVSDVLLVADIVTGQKYIIKRYYKSRLSKLRSFQCIREVKLHCALSHPNIVTIYGAFEDAHTVNLLLEFAPLGDLYKTIMGKGAPEKTAAKCISHVLEGLLYLHERNVIHRDIKLENILSCDTGFKLADFGLSINAADERPVTKLGTGEYMSPEILRCLTKNNPDDHKDREDLKYGPEVDIWATGVLTFELLAGQSPFKSGDSATMLMEMERGPNFPSSMPPDAVSFIKEALCLDPKLRPSATDLLNHPWLRKFNFRTASKTTTGLLQRRGSIGAGVLTPAAQITPNPAAPPAPSGSAFHSSMAASQAQVNAAANAGSFVEPGGASVSQQSTITSGYMASLRAKSFSTFRVGNSTPLQTAGSIKLAGGNSSSPIGPSGSTPSSLGPLPSLKKGSAGSPRSEDLSQQLKQSFTGLGGPSPSSFRAKAGMFQSAELTYVSNLDAGGPYAASPSVTHAGALARKNSHTMGEGANAGSPRVSGMVSKSRMDLGLGELSGDATGSGGSTPHRSTPHRSVTFKS